VGAVCAAIVVAVGRLVGGNGDGATLRRASREEKRDPADIPYTIHPLSRTEKKFSMF
jgi:hypothetical protein